MRLVLYRPVLAEKMLAHGLVTSISPVWFAKIFRLTVFLTDNDAFVDENLQRWDKNHATRRHGWPPGSGNRILAANVLWFLFESCQTRNRPVLKADFKKNSGNNAFHSQPLGIGWAGVGFRRTPAGCAQGHPFGVLTFLSRASSATGAGLLNIMSQPKIIQGGMGVAVSGWKLARTISRLGQLGVVSGTGLAIILARNLQLGDLDGRLRHALHQFPIPAVAARVLAKYFIPGGKAPAGAIQKCRPAHAATRARR